MQPRLHSLLEQLVNVGTGFITSLLIWEFVIKPGWGIQTDFADNFQITAIFTGISVLRGYVFRRAANAFTVRQQKQKENEHATADWSCR